MPQVSRLLTLVSLALLVATVFVVDPPGETVWQRELKDAGHGPVFAAIAVLLALAQAPWGPGGRRTFAQYLMALALTVALGALTEWGQNFLPNRSASLSDLLHDALGGAFGLGVLSLVEHRQSDSAPAAKHGGWLWALVLGTLLALAWAPLRCARAYAARLAAFPTLAPLGPLADGYFASAHHATLSHGELPPSWRHAGEEGVSALRLDFGEGTRPALELTELQGDWRGRHTLSLDMTNPGEAPATFVLRILDERHDWSHEDRLNLPVVIAPRTRTTLRVSLAAIEQAPSRRAMDLGAVADLMLFATGPSSNRSFYVSRIWLE
jgi:hypothetical protein